MSVVKSEHISKKRPEKKLLAHNVKKAGRSHGKISVRHQGGGHKQRYRIIDTKQKKLGVNGTIIAIERDPNRSSYIALVKYDDGDKRYILATDGVYTGSQIIVSESAPVQIGNRLKLKNIPSGYVISNIEVVPGKGGQVIRSAGSGATIMGHDEKYAQIKLASGEVRLINRECYATIGRISNGEHNLMRVGKAGKSRWMNKRPAVRGTAMNPVDHPHGGGEGRQPLGVKHPKTPWGKPALGKKTRSKSKYSDKFIIKRRSSKKK